VKHSDSKPFNIIPASPEEIDFIGHKLDEYNNSQEPFTQNPIVILKNYVIKEHSNVIAGIGSDIYCWGILYIEFLYVDEQYRDHGLGSALLNQVENEAKELDVALVHTDTYDFQAKDFYLKNGYTIFGILDDCPKGHKRYYLKKKL
jgi:ribosomal protein S18 acetylase RimI-like enzyme